MKNTKRRIYDAINVMIAANVLSKKGQGRLKLIEKKGCEKQKYQVK